METEEWRVISDFPKYHVSSQGRIRNLSTNEIRKTQINHQGFPTLVLYNSPDPSRYIRQVNKLVMEAFGPEPKYRNETSVWHINGDIEDCRASNLKWDTRARVLEWNEMHRTMEPKLRTPQVIVNATGRVFTNAFECALNVGDLESAIVAHIERYPQQHEHRTRYRYVE